LEGRRRKVKDKDDKIKAMAELLLAKATMLQYHCGKCGSPLFQKDDKIICPVCGELEKLSKKEAEEKAKVAPGDQEVEEQPESKKFQGFIGKDVVVKTESTAYRGKCERVDDETLSITLSNAEKLKPFTKPTEAEWSPLSELLFIHGNMIEAVWLEKKKD
jgi:uncharacterized Zn finger protein (UPF0148 family)